MAHDHSHGNDSSSEYYIEQLFTIFVCGAVGLVAIRMYQTDMLRHILAEPFHVPVLVGGIGVLVLVALRAAAVWREAGAGHSHSHDHGSHDHAHHDHLHDHAHHDHLHDHRGGHDHSHDHADEDHGHSHDLSWTFARLLVLVFPVALYLLGLPNAGFSQEHQRRLLGHDESVGPVEFGATTEQGEGIAMRFNDLNGAAFDPAKRKELEGQTVILKGKLNRIGEKEFTLYKLKMTCCAADTTPLKVRLITRQSLSGFDNLDWVRVKGQIQFVQSPGADFFIPLIKVADLTDIQRIPAESDYE